jgi:sporulation protein YlmC with PRC-barrel domain
MLQPALLAALLVSVGATGAAAQPAPKAQTSPPITHEAGPPGGGDAKRLIGRSVKNADNEIVGEIKSIHLNADGRADAVMVSVGGLLGIPGREVKLGWTDLRIASNGEVVTTHLTKEQVKALPEYLYKDPTYRGMVFGEMGIWMPAHDNLAAHATVSTGDFNADGQISAKAVIGATVKNDNKETVGKVVDAYLDDKGSVKQLVVSVGGFLGVGSKSVAVNWSDIRFTREGKSLVLLTDWTKESLKAMPDYTNELRVPAHKAGG